MTSQPDSLLLSENRYRLQVLDGSRSQNLSLGSSNQENLQDKLRELEAEVMNLRRNRVGVPGEINQPSEGNSSIDSSALTPPPSENEEQWNKIGRRKEYLRDKQEDFYLSTELLNCKNMIEIIKGGIKKNVWPVCKALVGSASEIDKPDFVSCNFPNRDGVYPEPGLVVQVVELLFEYLGWENSDLKKKVLFWKTYKSIVKRELSDFRTTTVGLIRKSFLKYYKAWAASSSSHVEDENSEDIASLDGDDDDLVYYQCFGKFDMDEFVNCCREMFEKGLDTRVSFRDLLRTEITGEEDKAAYRVMDVFVSIFLAHSYRYQYFSSERLKNKVSTFTTVSDEAFALCILENYMNVWINDFENKSREKADRLKTHQRLSPENPESAYHEMQTNRKNLFSIDFINAYNEYMTTVTENRKTEESRKFEQMYRDMYKKKSRNAKVSFRGTKRKQSDIEVAMPKLVSSIKYVPVNMVEEEGNGEDNSSQYMTSSVGV